ncbi:ribosomal protein S14, S11 [Puccinia graminis f. sp. tritici]|nr:ribosomal protein S14, S11 [Puccinia graminis f. sp. tritici]
MMFCFDPFSVARFPNSCMIPHRKPPTRGAEVVKGEVFIALGSRVWEGGIVFDVAHMFVSFRSTFVVVANLFGRETVCRFTGGMIVRADQCGILPYDTRLAARDHLGPVDKPSSELPPVRVWAFAELTRPRLSLPTALTEDERTSIYNSSDWSSPHVPLRSDDLLRLVHGQFLQH